MTNANTQTPAAILSIACIVTVIALSWFLIDRDKTQAEIHASDVAPLNQQCKSMPIRGIE
jgi:hypothetical protein